MSHVFHQLYFHFAWARQSRELLIDRVWRPELLEIINEEVKTRGGWPIRHNAMPDHAHLLCRLPPTVLIAEFIGQVKRRDFVSCKQRDQSQVQTSMAGRLRSPHLAQGRTCEGLALH